MALITFAAVNMIVFCRADGLTKQITDYCDSVIARRIDSLMDSKEGDWFMKHRVGMREKRDANAERATITRDGALRRMQTRIERMEKQQVAIGHQFMDYRERLNAQHAIILRQSNLIEEQLKKVTTVEGQMDLLQARLQKVVVDQSWLKVSLKSASNSSMIMRQGLKNMDNALQSMYSEHGHFYHQSEILTKDVNLVKTQLRKVESHQNLMENSLRNLIYLQQEPSANVSSAQESLDWLNISSSVILSNSRTTLPSAQQLTNIKHNISELAKNFHTYQLQVDEISLDLEQLKDEIFTFYKYLEGTRDQMNTLQRNAANSTAELQRRLLARMRLLEEGNKGQNPSSTGFTREVSTLPSKLALSTTPEQRGTSLPSVNKDNENISFDYRLSAPELEEPKVRSHITSSTLSTMPSITTSLTPTTAKPNATRSSNKSKSKGKKPKIEERKKVKHQNEVGQSKGPEPLTVSNVSGTTQQVPAAILNVHPNDKEGKLHFICFYVQFSLCL